MGFNLFMASSKRPIAFLVAIVSCGFKNFVLFPSLITILGVPNGLSLMLATDDHSTLDKWDKIYCEEKYDGVRVIALYKNGEFSYFTRAFNELDATCFPKITFDLKTCIINSGLKGDWFFDGEGIGLHYRANEISKDAPQLDIYLTIEQSKQILQPEIYQQMF